MEFKEYMGYIIISDGNTSIPRDCDIQLLNGVIIQESLTLDQIIERYDLDDKTIMTIKNIQNE